MRQFDDGERSTDYDAAHLLAVLGSWESLARHVAQLRASYIDKRLHEQICYEDGPFDPPPVLERLRFGDRLWQTLLILGLLGSALLVGLAFAVVASLMAAGPWTFAFINRNVNEVWRVPVATAIVVVSGGCLYLLRRDRRPLYGLLEILFALGSASLSVGHLLADTSDRSAWMAVIASTYLLVRGLDNALEKPTRDQEWWDDV